MRRIWDLELRLAPRTRPPAVACARALGLLLRLGNLALSARLLGLGRFGDLLTALAVGSIATLPLSLGFKTSVFAHVPRYEEAAAFDMIGGFRDYAISAINRSARWWAMMSLGLAAILRVSAVELWWIPIAAVALGLSTVLLNLETEIARGRDRPLVSVAFEQLLPQAVLLGFIAGLSVLGASVATLVAAISLSSALAFFALHNLHRIVARRPDSATRDRWASYRVPMILGGLGQMILAQSPILLLRSFSSAEAAGGFGTAYRVAALVNLVPGALAAALSPRISMAISANRWTEARSTLRGLRFANLAIVVLLVGCLAIGGRWVLDQFGAGFANFKGDLIILALGFGVGAVAGPVATLLIAMERRYWVMATYLGIACAFLLSVLAAWPVEATRTAVILAIAMALQNLTQATLVHRLWRRQ